MYHQAIRQHHRQVRAETPHDTFGPDREWGIVVRVRDFILAKETGSGLICDELSRKQGPPEELSFLPQERLSPSRRRFYPRDLLMQEEKRPTAFLKTGLYLFSCALH